MEGLGSLGFTLTFASLRAFLRVFHTIWTNFQLSTISTFIMAFNLDLCEEFLCIRDSNATLEDIQEIIDGHLGKDP